MFNLRKNIYISAWFVPNASDLYLFSRVYPAAVNKSDGSAPLSGLMRDSKRDME